jgi:hypothetical protein
MTAARASGPCPSGRDPGGVPGCAEAGAAGDSMDDDWQVLSVTVATPELIDPLLAGGVAELNRVVVVEHEETRVSVVRVC